MIARFVALEVLAKAFLKRDIGFLHGVVIGQSNERQCLLNLGEGGDDVGEDAGSALEVARAAFPADVSQSLRGGGRHPQNSPCDVRLGWVHLVGLIPERPHSR